MSNFYDPRGVDCETWVVGTGADPGIYFGGSNQGPQSKIKGEARIEGAKRPSIDDDARVEGAKRPRMRAKPEPREKPEKKRGEGSGEGAR